MVLYNRNANYAQDPALNGPFNDINPDRHHSMHHNILLERIRHHDAAMQVIMHCIAAAQYNDSQNSTRVLSRTCCRTCTTSRPPLKFSQVIFLF